MKWTLYALKMTQKSYSWITVKRTAGISRGQDICIVHCLFLCLLTFSRHSLYSHRFSQSCHNFSVTWKSQHSLQFSFFTWWVMYLVVVESITAWMSGWGLTAVQLRALSFHWEPNVFTVFQKVLSSPQITALAL